MQLDAKRIKSFVRQQSSLCYAASVFMRWYDKIPILGRHNVIDNKGVMLHVDYHIRGNNNRVYIAPGAILTDVNITIHGNNHQLVIGRNCKIRASSFWFEDTDGQLLIGQETTIEGAHLAVTEPNCRIRIGNDCMFASGIEVRTGDSHTILDRASGQRINLAQDVTIGDHVWVGAGATVLKGTSIGSQSIISTGAIVTSDVPPNTIAAGVPARVVKTNINWCRERLYTTTPEAFVHAY